MKKAKGFFTRARPGRPKKVLKPKYIKKIIKNK
jgi:predicted RNA binding protein YcfA (HicA-like mRNA interferase family)